MKEDLTPESIERLAVKHESFGFGQVDSKGYTTHGFDPEGLAAFVAELESRVRANERHLNSIGRKKR